MRKYFKKNEREFSKLSIQSVGLDNRFSEGV